MLRLASLVALLAVAFAAPLECSETDVANAIRARRSLAKTQR